jgi:eukaryotic-like serine/threonine-protein kinase
MGFVTRMGSVFRLFVLFMVLVAVALISAATTIRLTIHSGEEKAPNVVGLSLEAAQRVAGAGGLGIHIEDHLFNSEYPENHIISQVPAADNSTKAGQDIHVLVSLGTPRVKIPELVGDSVRAAQVTAVQSGLTVRDVATVHWAGTEIDQVVAQEPPPSAEPPRSPSVSLLVSLGEPAPGFVCPSFIGRPIAEVRSQITQAGFVVGGVQTEPTPPNAPGSSIAGTAPPAAAAPAHGTVLNQTPAPGSEIAAGISFNFTVAP